VAVLPAFGQTTALLQKGIDAGKAKAGDAVEIRITSKVRLDSGAILSKGTRIAGVVAVAEPRLLTLRLDRAIGRDGHETPIRAVISTLSAPVQLNVFATPMGNFGEYGSPSQRPPGDAPVPLAGLIDGGGGTAHPAGVAVAGRSVSVGRVMGYGWLSLLFDSAAGESSIRSMVGKPVVLASESALTLLISEVP
jgi:hypothetical protein